MGKNESRRIDFVRKAYPMICESYRIVLKTLLLTPLLSLSVVLEIDENSLLAEDLATPVPSLQSKLELGDNRSLATIVFGSLDTRQQKWANSEPEVVQATVVDFNSTNILFQFPGESAIKTRSAADVVDISFQWTSQEAADAETAFQNQAYAEVVRAGKAAITAGNLPGWQQRILVARMVEAFSNAGQKVLAGKLFLSLLKDSAPPLVYQSAPLFLQNGKLNASMLQAAEAWAQDTTSVDAQLLGASWLIGTAKSDLAKEVLQKLATDKNVIVASLAISQSWRSASPKEVSTGYQDWKITRNRLPVWLQAGPDFIIADKLERSSLKSEALQEYLRIISLHKSHGWVTHESIRRAKEILNEQNRTEEANLLGKQAVGNKR